MKRPGYVYFIQAGEGGPIKIGWAKDPDARLRLLQTAHHETLVIRTAVKSLPHVEKNLHEEFAEARIRGEWFRPTPELEHRISVCPPYVGWSN